MPDIFLVRAEVEFWALADNAGHARGLVRTHLADAGAHYVSVDDGRALDEAAADAEWEADSGLAFNSGRQPVLGTDIPAAEALRDALEDAKYGRYCGTCDGSGEGKSDGTRCPSCRGSGHPRRAS